MNVQSLAERLKESWPCPLVPRNEVGKFSGGLLNSGTMANLDSRGEGPRGKVAFGKVRVAYDRDLLIDWLVSRLGGQS